MTEILEKVIAVLPADIAGVIVLSLIIIYWLLSHLDKAHARYEKTVSELSENQAGALTEMAAAVNEQKEAFKCIMPIILTLLKKDNE